MTESNPTRRSRRRSSPSTADSPQTPAGAEEKEQVSSLLSCPSDLNLFQRIIWVRQHLPTITKDKKVAGQYDVITHENINTFLRPLMNAAGLVDDISETKMKVVDSGKKMSNGNTVWHCRGVYIYCLTRADKPEETRSIIVSGWGEDAGDKGPGKAQTYAFKAGRTKVFSIAAGENEEGRIPDDKLAGPPTISAEQISDLLEEADKLFGNKAEGVLMAMAKAVFPNCDHYNKIPADGFSAAMNNLHNKAKRDGIEVSAPDDDIPA